MSAKIVAVVPTMRGIIAVASDGRTWYLADPYFGDKEQWRERSAVPLQRNTEPSERRAPSHRPTEDTV